MKKLLYRHKNLRALLLITLVPLITFVPLMVLKVDAAPNAAPSISVSPASGLAGSTVTVTGSGFTEGFNAAIRWDGVDQVTFTMPKGGSFSSPLTIPSSAAPGPHTISVCNYCGGGEFEENASVGFKVTQPPTKTLTPQPPPVVTITPQVKPITSTPTLTPTVTGVPSICETLGLGPEAIVIDFDDLSPGSILDRELVSEFGVGFEGSLEVTVPLNDAHSPDYAGKSLETYEFGGSINMPIRFTFSQGVQAIGMYLGVDSTEGVSGAVTASLQVWGTRAGGGSLNLGSSTLTFPSIPTDIEHCIEFTAGEGEMITRATLEYKDDTGASIFPYRLIDDLTILPLDIPLPEDQIAPEVEITSPREGETIRIPSVAVRANIYEDRELREVWFSPNTSGVERLAFSASPSDPTLYTTGVTTSDLIPNAENSVTIWGVDAAGLEGSDTVTFFYDPPTPVPSLDILPYKYELTQAIQCLETPVGMPRCGADNSIPMYTGKPTLLRLYAYATGTATDVPNISALLCRDTFGDCIRAMNMVSVSPWASISSLNNPVRSYRGDLSRTLNFMIPSRWESTDFHTFTLRVNPDGENADEIDLANNDLTFQFRYQRSKSLDVVMIPVAADCGGWTCAPSLLTHGGLALSKFERLYPTGNIRLWTIGANINLNGDYNYSGGGGGCGDGWGDLLDDLWWYNFWNDDPVDYLRYYGMVDELVTHGPHGCGYRPGDESASIVNTGAAHWVDYAGKLMAEEIGHNHGRRHPPGGSALNTDGSYPVGIDVNGNVNPIIGEWGIDLRSMTLHPPNAAYDFMGYVGGAGTRTDLVYYSILSGGYWVSPYTYRGMASAIDRVAQIPTMGQLMSLIPVAQPEPLYLVGSLRVTSDSTEVRRGFYVIPPSQDLMDFTLEDEGPFLVELVDERGEVLLSNRFAPAQVSEPGASEIIQVLMPWREGTASINISKDGNLLLTTVVSPNSPSVQLITPEGGETWQSGATQLIQWEGMDPDGDPLKYNLQYSTDGGDSWLPLVTDTEETSYELDLSKVAGSEQAKFRVTTSDGVNTSTDSTESTLSIGRKPPQVSILNPIDDQTYPTGEQIIFEGSAVDLEDRVVESTAFQWSSDRDGAMGQGSRLYGVALSQGRHQITLTVTDQDGMSASAMISVVIGAEEAIGVTITEAVDEPIDETSEEAAVPEWPPWALPLLAAIAFLGIAVVVFMGGLIIYSRSKDK
ncbi:MAG: hypothetical protein GTO18_12850 [Anaerolineales bacterium]|nr:hypothetical protein [Anaerolineales bacterium]